MLDDLPRFRRETSLASGQIHCPTVPLTRTVVYFILTGTPRKVNHRVRRQRLRCRVVRSLCILTTAVRMQLLRPDLIHDAFRNIREVDP